MYLKIELPDTTIVVEDPEQSSVHLVKVINKTHFATIHQGKLPIQDMFNCGKYSLTADTYTEHVELFSIRDNIGKSFTFESKLEADKWTIKGPILKEGDKDPGWKVKEVYKRIK